MPCAVITADKLQHLTGAANDEVCGDCHAANLLKVGMRVPVQGVGEKRFNLWAAVLTRWQADGVQHDQIDAGVIRPWAKVG